MTLQGLLTFLGLLLASYSAIRQPYRDLVRVFISPIWVLSWITPALLALLWPHLMRVAGQDVCPDTAALLESVGFLLPIGCLGHCVAAFTRSRLTKRRAPLLKQAWRSARSEGAFEGIRWVIERNLSRLASVTGPDVAEALFDPTFVERTIGARSWLHLEMLASEELVALLPDRYAASDAVIRAILAARGTVVHRWVAKTHGGQDRVTLTNAEQSVLAGTFESPAWYMKVGAYYPLAMYPIERLSSAEYDQEYNGSAEFYGLGQGTARRSYCPVWVATKVMVLAISRAIAEREMRDMYVSTLWDIFRAVADRSRKSAFVAQAGRRSEHPTPYAYLMNDICRDLNELCREACRTGMGPDGQGADPKDAPQFSIVAQIWAGCLGYLAARPDASTQAFRSELLIHYLNFMLQVGFWPRDALISDEPVDATIRQRYRDVLARELIQAIGGDQEGKRLVLDAAGRLDPCKTWVREGQDWFRVFGGGFR